MQKMTFDKWLATGGEIYGSESVWNAAYKAALLDAASYFKITYNEIWTGAAVSLRLRNIADYVELNAKVNRPPCAACGSALNERLGQVQSTEPDQHTKPTATRWAL